VAGLGRKVFVAGEILQAAELQGYAVDQSVMVFDDATARTAAIPSPTEGMVTYRKDTKLVEAFTGSAFQPVGRILQVVSTTKTDTFTTTSTSYTDLTGLSAAITPSSTASKVLVFVTISGHGTANTNLFHAQLVRGATAIALGDTAGNRSRATFSFGFSSAGSEIQQSGSTLFLDSPNTTSSTTYKVQIKANTTGTLYVNRTQDSSDNALSARTTSTITLMEVAG
jgi:hypothetical protein